MRKLSKEELGELSSDEQREYREKLVKLEWVRYQITKDRRHLANICKDMPFFGNSEVGKEIARLLTLEHSLTPITKEPKLRTRQINQHIKALWNAWSDSVDENGKKIQEWKIMAAIGREVSITGEDDHAKAENIRGRLREMGLK